MTKEPKRVVVFMGGISSEREVSLMSGKGVKEALESKGFDITVWDPAVDAVETLEDGKFDAAFNALHGKFGEDGTIQGLCNAIGLPYTGPGVQASAVTMDKALTKLIWREAGIPVPRGIRATTETTDDELDKAIRTLGADGVVVKPDRDGSSIGVTKIQGKDLTREVLRKALDDAASVAKNSGDASVLIEEYIHGREFTIALLDGKALPVIEIVAPEGAYDFQNKYYTDVTKYICPAEIPFDAAASLQQTCEAAYRAVGCRGWSRVDAMQRPDGSFVLLEINTSPGMTPHSLVPMAAREVGLDYASLCEKVLSLASLD